MSDGIGRRDLIYIALGLLGGLGALAGVLVWMLRDAPLEADALTEEQRRSLDQMPIEAISPDAEPRADFEPHRALKDGAGGLLVTGVVKNTSATWVERPLVSAVCLDARGAELSRAQGAAEREVLLPTGSSPVQIAVPGGVACDHLAYEVTARKPDVVAVYAAGLRVASNQLDKDAAGGWEITGTVVNEGDRRARYVQVQVLALDVAGRIVGVNSVFAKGDLLEPGGTTRFRLGPLRYLDPPDRFEFSAYGRTAD